MPVSEAIRGLSKEFRDHDSLNPKRDPLCILEYANQGSLPDSYESYPRIQFKCVEKGYTPDNPETPELMQNPLVLNLQQAIAFYGDSKDPFVITHMRAGHGMTRRGIRKSTEPSVVHNGLHPGQSRHSAKLRFLRKHTQDENSLRWFEVADAVHQLRHDRIRDALDQCSELSHSAGHWSGGQRLEDPRKRI